MGELVLAIETSCDETSVAVVRDRKILGLSISSQIDIHREFGGVVPEIASRKHIEAILPVMDDAMEQAGVNFKDIDLIASTQGPGLIGALLVGISAAKSLAIALDIPIVAVNHMRGHIAANYIENNLEPPYIALVVSGGHTYLIEVLSYTEMKLRGRTRDDAAGEAYDKIGRRMGLAYPGGPVIDKLAKNGKDIYNFPRVIIDGYDFSFSGLKTAVINKIHEFEQRGEDFSKEDMATSFQEAVVDVLVEKTFQLIDETGLNKIAISGGVSANSRLQERVKEVGDEKGVQVFFPSPIYSTDNAAMIGVEGLIKYKAEGGSDLSFRAIPNLGLGDL